MLENRDALMRIADALIARDELTGAEVMALIREPAADGSDRSDRPDGPGQERSLRTATRDGLGPPPHVQLGVEPGEVGSFTVSGAIASRSAISALLRPGDEFREDGTLAGRQPERRPARGLQRRRRVEETAEQLR